MKLQLLSIAVLTGAAGFASAMQSISSSEPLERVLPCSDSLRDQSGGACIQASSVPTLGMLCPLSSDLFVHPSTGWIGLGTTNPYARLTVNGNAGLDGDLSFRGIEDGILFSTFNPYFVSPSPLITMFDSGTTNADRMVLAHSPTFSNFGLAYQDSTDRFRFQSSPSHAVLEVDLNSSQVDVDGNLDVDGRIEVQASSGRAIYAANSSTISASYGVYGFGMFGVVGEAAPGGFFGLYASGAIGGTGTKSFVQPHPHEPTKQIRYISLEGNEAGTYFRGTARLEGGRAIIEVPEDFRLVTEEVGMTVQVTPLGDVRTWVEERNLERIVVRGREDVVFDYFVNGVRLGFAGHEPIEENHAFVPQYRDEAFHPQLPTAVRDLMVESGILNADHTPDEGTAARLGWTLVDRETTDGRR